MVIDTGDSSLRAICEKCEREGPSVPGPGLPLTIKNYIVEAERISFLAIGKFFEKGEEE